MTTTVLRYQAKPERAEENQQLIEAVFAELDEREPDGFTYKVFRLEDGVSFIRVDRARHQRPRLAAGSTGFPSLHGRHRRPLRLPTGSDGSNPRRRLPVTC